MLDVFHRERDRAARRPPPTRRGCCASARPCAARRRASTPRRSCRTRASFARLRAALRRLAARARRERLALAGAASATLARRPPALEGVELHGLIDRIDRLRRRDGPTIELIDYKTGSAEQLRDTVREPLEDTQLAFYAALSRGRRRRAEPRAQLPRARRARRRSRSSSTPTLPTSARALVDGIGDEMARLRAGAACRRWAKARRATTARRAACAGATTGRARATTRADERAGAYRARSARRASTARGVLRRRLRPARAASSSRPAPAPARPGCWSRASCARCSTAREPHEILAITFTRKAAGEMRERLDEWLRRVRRAACDPRRARARRCASAASTRRGARALAPALAALHDRVLRGRAARSRSAPSTPGSRSCCAPRRSSCSTASACSADMELIEDPAEHGPSVIRALPRGRAARDAGVRADSRGAGRATRPARSSREWLDVGLGQAGRVRARRCRRHARDERRAGRRRLAGARRLRASGRALLATPRATRSAATQLRRCRGARQGGARRRRASCSSAALRRIDAAASASTPPGRRCSRRDGEPRKCARAPASSTRCRRACRSARPGRTSTTRTASTRAWFGWRACCSPSSPPTSACAAWPTWPTSSAARSRCCATPSCRAGCRSGSTRASRHLLIDEFQDTSPLQWHALHAWLVGYAGAGGGASGQRPPGVFIVGDPKQSIYRFRRAEPRVFEAARDVRRRGPRRQRARLRPHAAQRAGGARRRSTRCSTRARRRAFAGLSPRTRPRSAARPGARRVAAAARAAPAAPPRAAATTPAAGLARQPDARRASCPKRCCASRRRRGRRRGRGRACASRPRRAGEIYVLCRKRESLRLVADALRARPCRSPRPRTPLLEAPEARDLVARARRARLAAAHACRSRTPCAVPLFGATDDDLVALAHAARRRTDATGGECADGAGALPAARPLPRAPRAAAAAGAARRADACRRTTCSTASSPKANCASASPPPCRPSGARPRSARSTRCSAQALDARRRRATRRRTTSCAR